MIGHSQFPKLILEAILAAPDGLSVKQIMAAIPCSLATAQETARMLAKQGAPITKTTIAGPHARWVRKDCVERVRREIAISLAAKVKQQKRAEKLRRAERTMPS